MRATYIEIFLFRGEDSTKMAAAFHSKKFLIKSPGFEVIQFDPSPVFILPYM